MSQEEWSEHFEAMTRNAIPWQKKYYSMRGIVGGGGGSKPSVNLVTPVAQGIAMAKKQLKYSRGRRRKKVKRTGETKAKSKKWKKSKSIKGRKFTEILS